jgi:hypothetical protein
MCHRNGGFFVKDCLSAKLASVGIEVNIVKLSATSCQYTKSRANEEMDASAGILRG